MRRREFLKTVGGVAACWPLTARAQRPDVMQRIGVLEATGEDDPQNKAKYAAFEQELQQLGWTKGRNLRIDYRWGGGDPDTIRKQADELLAFQPSVILASGSSGTGQMLRATRTVPIVFAIVPDPVGSGYVQSLAQPGGNATGFVQFEYSLSGKWVELLKQLAPAVTRALVLWDPSLAAGIGQFAIIQSVAPAAGVDVRPVDLHDPAEVERSIKTFSNSPNGGLIVTGSAWSVIHRDRIIALAARHRLPAVYPSRQFVVSGGLISYGADFIDQYRRAAGYVDRILKGEKPADLPVQAPTKYELVINLKAAKALGLAIPPTLLARADEVIE
jgi:putative ABC transport system substrate-binding protein